jgi:outer membrane protein assembly factor BamB
MGQLAALRTVDGNITWSRDFKTYVHGSIAVSPSTGTLFFADFNGAVHAVDPLNGTELWLTPTAPFPIASTPAL